MSNRLLFVLNYYSPYISGVTEYVRLLCECLVKYGYDVTVLASNHAKLPDKETINGVKVIRAPIIFKISKGIISPAFIRLARKLSRNADIVNLHLPMLESGLIALLVDKEKIVSTYHCDVNLPSNILNKLIMRIMDLSHNICLYKSRKILVTTKDYALHSRVAYKYGDKMIEAYTPIKEVFPTRIENNYGKKTIGFCGRIVEEKGIDVLLRSFRLICQERNDVQLLIGGDYENVAGGSIYPSLIKYIEEIGLENVIFLGKIPENKMSEFYSSLDVFVLPSINTLEAFGMVQIEAMRCGTPVVASDLYGVRTIISNTGMGLVCKKNDVNDLARCILEVLRNREKYVRPLDVIEALYSTQSVVYTYEQCFQQLLNSKN